MDVCKLQSRSTLKQYLVCELNINNISNIYIGQDFAARDILLLALCGLFPSPFISGNVLSFYGH